MRGELDDALARLERWDEVRRQLHHGATGAETLLDEVVRAVTPVLGRRGAGTVTLTVTDAGGSSTVELTARDGTVHSGAPAESAAPAKPSRSAARLAEMIRQNPSLLDGLRAGTDPV
jgi:hypothetical protein